MIKEVYLKNWRTYKEASVEFTKGINFVYGLNGSGKTSLLEAIMYGLYGSDWVKIAGEKLENYQRYEALRKGEETIVQVKFIGRDGREYIVRRTIKGGRSVVDRTRIVQGGRTLARGDKNVTAVVIEALGITPRAFRDLLYVRQGELKDILYDSRRKQKLDELLRLKFMDVLKQALMTFARNFDLKFEGIKRSIHECDAIIRKLEQDIKAKESRIDELKSRIAEYEERVKKLKETIEAYERHRDELEKTINEYRLKMEKLSNLREMIKEKERSLNKLLEEKRYLEKEIESLAELEEEYKRLEEELKEIEPIAKAYSELSSYVETLNQLDGMIKQLKNIIAYEVKEREKLHKSWKEKIAKLSGELEQLRKRLEVLGDEDSLRERLSKLEAVRSELLGRKGMIEDVLELARKGSTGSCPLCMRPLTSSDYARILNHHENELRNISEKLTAVEKEIEELKERLEELRIVKTLMSEKERRLKDEERRLSEEITSKNERIENLKRRLSELERKRKELAEKVKDFDRVKEAYEKYNRLLERKRSLERQLSKLPELREKLERVTSEIAKCKEEITKLRSEARKLERELSDIDIGRLENKLETIKNLIERNRETYEKYAEQLNKYRGEVESLRREIEENMKELEDRRARKQKLSEAYSKVETAVNFARSLSVIIEKAIPEIRSRFIERVNEEVNYLFRELKHKDIYESVSLDENYNIYIRQSDGVELTVNAVSGGEATVLALIVRYAIAKSVLGEPPIFILDEPTEHMDREHLRRFIKWLAKIGTYSQVIITSHIEDFKEVSDRQIHVAMVGNYAVIE